VVDSNVVTLSQSAPDRLQVTLARIELALKRLAEWVDYLDKRLNRLEEHR
jgi:hypothetical protein